MFDPKALAILEDVLESMNDSILVDDQNKIIYFSESYAADLGISSADAIGRDVRETIANTRMHYVIESGQPESAEGFIAKYQTKNGEGADQILSPYHVINRIPVRKKGSPEGKPIAAFAYTVLQNDAEFQKALQLLNTVRQENRMYSDAISDAYTTDHALDKLKGSSPAARALREQIRKIAKGTLTVSVTGETGTGKEVVTSAIHELSFRKNKPFIKINCAAIPDALLESELFGYEPGSFTGASKNGKMGKFELANKGTILLDEIGEMPLFLQAKLLRVLQENEIERIGGKQPIPIDVRILCSTNRNLEDLVRQGKFRQDLYYRLNVMTLELPPLRNRLEDIPELCRYFVEKSRQAMPHPVREIAPEVYSLLESYSWPGNIRELEHVIECACVIADHPVLTTEDFSFLENRIRKASLSQPEESPSMAAKTADPSETSAQALYDRLLQEQIEKERAAILAALAKNKHNVSKTAKELGISRSTLYRKLREFRIGL